MNVIMDKAKLRRLSEEANSFGVFGHSKAFALRIGMAIILEEDQKPFQALCLREEAYAILRLFYRRRICRKRKRTSE